MSEITVKAKSKYPDQVGARSIFIDSVGNGETIELEIVIEGQSSEFHQVQAGSSINSLDFIIDEIIFHNKTVADIDVEFHSSTLIKYNESKVAGNVNATIVGDVNAALLKNSVDSVAFYTSQIRDLAQQTNLTKNNNQYIGGFNFQAVAGLFSKVNITNDLGSGKNIYLTSIALASSAGEVVISRELGDVLVNFTSGSSLSHSKNDGGVNGAGIIYAGLNSNSSVNIITKIPTDPSGAMTLVDFSKRPIHLSENSGITVSSGIVGNTCSATFEWEEE